MRISFVFSYSKKHLPIFSWLVKYFLNTKYSHVALKLKLRSIPVIYHAAEGFCHFTTEERFLKENEIVDEFQLDIPESVRSEILDHCVNSVGKDYAMMQNVGIFVSLLTKIKENFFKNQGEMVNCSEEMYYILKIISHDTAEMLPDLVSPKDIHKLLTENLSDIEYIEEIK